MGFREGTRFVQDETLGVAVSERSLILPEAVSSGH